MNTERHQTSPEEGELEPAMASENEPLKKQKW